MEGSQILSKQLSYKQLSDLSVSTFYAEQLKNFIFGGLPPLRRTPNCGQNNCLTYNFLHCEFQISMLSSSKVSFWGGHFGGVCSLLEFPTLAKIIVSHTTSYILCFNFLCWAVLKFHFWGANFGGLPPGRPPNLVKIIVSHTTSYMVSFKFLCWAVQKLRFRGLFWGVRPHLGLPNLAKIIVSHTTSYILSFNFLCW